MNKYDRALKLLSGCASSMDSKTQDKLLEAEITLEELIDNYEFLNKERTKLLKQVDYLAMRISRDENIRFASVIGQSLDKLESEKQ